jgi:hypothetical protein
MRVISQSPDPLAKMHTMTKRQGKSGTIDVKALLREDEEFLRALVRTALQEVLEGEMTEALGAEKGERTAGRQGIADTRLRCNRCGTEPTRWSKSPCSREGPGDPQYRMWRVRPCGLLAGEPRCPAELVDERIKRAVLVIGRAEIAQSQMRLGVEALVQCRGEARLADSGFAGDQHDLTIGRLPA